MYSKNRGITYGAHLPMPDRVPAYRQPDRPRMQVPPNYSGHAIVDGEERSLGSVMEAEQLADPPAYDGPTPYFDDLPRVSDLGDSHRRPTALTLPATYEESPEEQPEETAHPVETDSSAAPAATPAVAKPSLFDLSRFPFGHGIGLEELLILGLILFFLHESTDCEDRGDLDETVILLGILLLLG